MMEIVTMSDAPTGPYTDLLHRLDDALVYHTPSYLRLLREMLDCEPCHLVAVDGQEILGVIPLMARESSFGRVLNSLPYFGSIGGVLAVHADVGRALLERYNRLVTDEAIAASTVVANPFKPIAESEIVHDLTDERVSYVTSLTGGTDALRARFHRSRRFNVRRARSVGVEVREDRESLGFLAEAQRLHMRAIGGRAKNDAFFDALATTMPKDAYRVYVAAIAGRPVAALLLLYFGKTVEYFTPATLPEERVHQPMAAIIDTAMTDAATAGFERWNWGGTWPSQAGLATFKQRWGGTALPYTYYVKVNAQSILDAHPAELLASSRHFYVRPFDRGTESTFSAGASG